MDVKEAIEILDNPEEFFECEIQLKSGYWEASEMAIEALKKLMPKEPTNTIRHHYEGMSCDKGDCPCCGATNTSDTYINYCCSCGQALDWREVE